MLTTLIPVYNGEKHLAETLRSVASQTRPPDRVIVLDNCSTDGSREVAQNVPGLRVEWRQNEKNVGLFGNLNRCLAFAAETDVLHLLMADDLITPKFYEVVGGAIEKVQGKALAYSYNDVINAASVRTETLARMAEGAPRVIPRNEYLGRQAELSTILLPAALFKTDRAPMRCKFEDLPQVADCLLLAEWAKYCDAIIEVPQYLCQYRVHPANTTTSLIFNLQSSVLDEWKVASAVLPWIDEPSLKHWVREQKVKCVFAGRCHVKADMVKRSLPDYAKEVRQAARRTVGPVCSTLARGALVGRDFLDTVRGRETKTTKLARLVGLAN